MARLAANYRAARRARQRETPINQGFFINTPYNPLKVLTN